MNDLVLVTGATGNVGREVVAALRRQGRRIRAATPNVEQARALLGEGIEYARFDFTEPETFAPTFDGVSAVFLVRPPPVSEVKRIMGPAIAHAASSGRPHVVTLSVMGAGSNPLVPHHAMEKLVRRAGLPYTHLRPSFFMQNLSTTYREEIRDRGEIFVPAGRGRTSFIDVRDIAEVAARVLGDAAYHGRAYTLTGSEALTYFEVAEIFTRGLGRPFRYANPTPREFKQRLREQGAPENFIRVLASIYFIARHGLAARVTPETEQLLGRAPITLEQFIRDHAALWQQPAVALERERVEQYRADVRFPADRQPV
jgi:uncharacterized protein YbjT (DUF2867 family)